jgi:putative phosphoesterase
MRRAAKRLIAVHGNSDPVEVRQAIPYVEVLELEGKRIGVIHPAWGGPPFEIRELLQDFTQPPDAVVFGHLHETINEISDGVLFLNPGQAYSSFMVPATIATLTLEDGGMRAEISVIEKGR